MALVTLVPVQLEPGLAVDAVLVLVLVLAAVVELLLAYRSVYPPRRAYGWSRMRGMDCYSNDWYSKR